jgi:hypothetical protein
LNGKQWLLGVSLGIIVSIMGFIAVKVWGLSEEVARLQSTRFTQQMGFDAEKLGSEKLSQHKRDDHPPEWVIRELARLNARLTSMEELYSAAIRDRIEETPRHLR